MSEEERLLKACDDGDIVSVRAALADGLSANTRGGGDDATCLMLAVKRGHEELFTMLLQQEDCDPSLEDSAKCTALHIACWLGRVGMVRQITSHPRQEILNIKNKFKETAIMTAVYFGQVDCVLALGQVVRVDLDTRDGKGRILEDIAR